MTECSFSHEPEKREAALNAPGSLPMIADSIDAPVGMVNRPAHYNRGNIEVLDFIRDQKLAFELGSVVKYVCRAGFKDPTKDVEDLEKAQFYLNFMVECARAARDGRKTPLTRELKKEPAPATRPLSEYPACLRDIPIGPAEQFETNSGFLAFGRFAQVLDADELLGGTAKSIMGFIFDRASEDDEFLKQFNKRKGAVHGLVIRKETK